MATLAEFADVLPPGTMDAWPKVAGILPEGSVLMGGTGLAIWLRHRVSEDLDFFTPTRLDPRHITSALSGLGDFTYDTASERIVRGTFDAVNIDIVAHPDDFRLGPPVTVDGLNVGSLQDITAGKCNAVSTRRQMRDYVDLMWIEEHGGITIEQGILLYLRKHAIDFDMEAVRGFLRHLTDFRHLDDDPAMSATFGDDIRDRVVAYFRRRATDIIAAFSQLLVDDTTATRAARPSEAEFPSIGHPELNP